MMPTFVLSRCAWCAEETQVNIKEFNRAKKQGRDYFFCSRSCTASYKNHTRSDRRVPVEKECPQCGKTFETLTGAKSKTYCSRSCASAGSVTDYRREKVVETGRSNLTNFTLDSIAKGLRKREAWKYREVRKYLDHQEITHEFEQVVGDYIYDLALSDKKILVEFDGQYHLDSVQLESDRKKDQNAEDHGWRVVRVRTATNQVVLPSLLYDKVGI